MRTHHVVRCLAVVAFALTGACAAPVADEGEEIGEHVASTQEAITNGDVDESDDPAVVALLLGGQVFCSGVLVAANVVATAAHCVTPSPPEAVYFGSKPGANKGVLVKVAGTRAHPDFDEDTLENDIAVVALAQRAPTAPVPVITRADDGAYTNRSIRIVGFGSTSGTAFDAIQKRSGQTKITNFTDSDFRFHAAPSQTCTGDSGGPAFANVGDHEAVIGLTSSGDADCASYGRDIRIDQYTTFLESYVHAYSAKTSPTAMQNHGCSSAPAMPASGISPLVVLGLASAFAARRRR